MAPNLTIEERDEANQHLDRSISFAFTGKYDLAIEAVKKAIQIDPEFAQAYNKLGDYYVRKGMNKEAASAYRTSLELDDNNENSHFDYGCTLASLGDYDLAMHELEKALQMKPDHYEIYSHIARISYERGMHSEAIENAKKFVCKRKRCYGKVYLACAYLAQGYTNNAYENFSRVVERYSSGKS